MPKMKTNRLMHKKSRVNAKGKVKFARAAMSHNTGKKSSKRNRQLTATKIVHPTNANAVKRMLPYSG